MPGVAGGMLSVPYDMGTFPVRDAGMPHSIPIGALASALANATPEQQRTVSPLLPKSHLPNPSGGGCAAICPAHYISSLEK